MALLYRNLNNDFSEYRETLLKYSSRAEIFSAPQPLEELLDRPYYAYYVLSGCCRLLLSLTNGNEKVNAVLKEGSILPMYSRSQVKHARQIFLFEPYPRVEMLAFTKKQYENLLCENPEILFKILTFYDNLAISLQYDMGHLLYADGSKRVVSFLVSCAERHGASDQAHCCPDVLTIRATQDMIATYIAMDRTNVSRHLQALKKKGCIEISRGKIVIKDLSSLEKILDE